MLIPDEDVQKASYASNPIVWHLARELLACRKALKHWDAFDTVYRADGLTEESAELFLKASRSQVTCLPEYEKNKT